MEVYGHAIAPAKLKDATENVFQIDAVVRDHKGDPIILLDPKYIRYKKHNRDKGSWLCVAHYNLRKTYPTIRKCIAVLAGNWSKPSMELIKSFGVEILNIPFLHIKEVASSFGVEFDWKEKDRETPRKSLETFVNLSLRHRSEMAQRLIAPVKKQLDDSVIDVIESTISEQRISGVEMLLKTESSQMLLRQYDSVAEALKGMVEFTSERRDVSVFLERDNDR